MNKIHPTSQIDDSVKLGENNIIGPYCVLTGNINFGNNNTICSHVVMHGNGQLNIGNGNKFYPFVSLHDPQDKKFSGEKSTLIIGNNNIFREYSTANPGTEFGNMVTKIGNQCLFMIGSHVAHDCEINDHVILANNVAIAGHVHIGKYSILGGLSAVHQRTRIGEHAMIGGMSAVADDVIPFGMVIGKRAHLAGLNIVGLRRRGFTKDAMHALRHAYETIFAESTENNFADRIEQAKKEFADSDEAQIMLNFIVNNYSAARSLCKPR